MPRGVLSRATLLGRAEPLEAEKAAESKALFASAHLSLTGVDALREDDLFVRLHVDRVFFVCGLSSVRRVRGDSRLALSAWPAQDAAAEVVTGDAYRAAAADPMRRLAPYIVRQINEERPEDVALFCESMGVRDAATFSLLWLDRLGFDARAVHADGTVQNVRIPWRRPVEKEADALSQLTLLAQQLWEEAPAGKAYRPTPTPVVVLEDEDTMLV